MLKNKYQPKIGFFVPIVVLNIRAIVVYYLKSRYISDFKSTLMIDMTNGTFKRRICTKKRCSMNPLV